VKEAVSSTRGTRDRNPVVIARLRNQLLARNPGATPEAVVAHFGAMQAQDYLGALWAVGLRSRAASESDVERAIEERRIVRCWPMRGTLHFVAAQDARWMIDLLAPRVLAKSRTRLERDFELDRRTLRRCRTIVERALRGNALTRQEIYAALDRGGVAADEGRGLHILFALAHERLICFGPRRGKQPAFVLFDEWLPEAETKEREEALATIAHRYLAGHAPAAVGDFAWWTGLTLREAKEAFALAGIDGTAAAGASRRSAPSASPSPIRRVQRRLSRSRRHHRPAVHEARECRRRNAQRDRGRERSGCRNVEAAAARVVGRDRPFALPTAHSDGKDRPRKRN
jgi:hypothetical protein